MEQSSVEYQKEQDRIELNSQIAVFNPSFGVGDIVEYRENDVGKIEDIKVISSREFDDPDFKHWAMMVYEIGDDWVSENEITKIVARKGEYGK